MSLDVLRARVAFRDRAFIDVMDLALRFTMVHWRLYAKVAIVTLAPCVALTLLSESVWGWTGAWIVALLLSFIAQVPFTVLASRLVFQEKVAASSVLRSAVTEMPRILVMRLGWTVLVGLGATLLVVPGVVLASMYLFVDEVMILERSRVVPAFGRSTRIGAGSRGDAFVGVLMVLVVPVLAIFLADVGGRACLGELLQFRAPPPAWAEGGSVLAVLGWFGVMPYLTTARFFTYLNVRTRAEGWDIQTRFAAIAARADAEQEQAA